MNSQRGIFTPARNCVPVPLSGIEPVPVESLLDAVAALCIAREARIASLFAMKNGSAQVQIMAILADDQGGRLMIGTSLLDADSFPSLSAKCPQAQLFEREIAEQFGIVPAGHPRFNPVRFHHSFSGRDAWFRLEGQDIQPSVIPFVRVEGSDVHEVAVGPVHAGIIEPGHFRFQCHGEKVFNLEISLGYQHRGIEKSLIGGPDGRSIHLVETAAGDSTIAHTTAYCQTLEALGSVRQIPLRAMTVRAILLELERMANHTGDIGALANDAAFLPTASYCGRIRGDFLNMTAMFCGNRFGRSAVLPGGVRFTLDRDGVEELKRRFKNSFGDLEDAANLLFESSTAVERFENCGILPRETAEEIGIVGVAARASGIRRDIRFDFPTGLFSFAQIPLVSCDSGDVYARAFVRWLEARNSASFILEQLDSLPQDGAMGIPVQAPKPDSIVVSMVEGWRGEVCHTAVTGPDGRFLRYKIVDPSFHNWGGLEVVLKDELIYNFPLCNKSFNLSYCGFDL